MPEYNHNVLNKLLGILDVSIKRLESLGSMDRDAFLNNPDAVDAAQNRLRLAIESCADIARHLIARSAWGNPSSYTQLFAILATQKVLPKTWNSAGRRMARLRNRLIHAYSLVTDLETYKHIERELPHLREFMSSISAYITKKDKRT